MGIVSDILFDKSQLTAEAGAEASNFIQWQHQKPLRLMMSCLGVDPHLRTRFGHINSLRGFYRAHFRQQGFGLVACEEVSASGRPTVVAIGKRRDANGRHTYVGTLALPLLTESYVFSTLATETETSGDRVAAALTVMQREGHVIEIDEASGDIVGWSADPYDGSTDAPALFNPSDAARFDSDFPDHPLSLTRFILKRLIDTIGFGPELQARLAIAEQSQA